MNKLNLWGLSKERIYIKLKHPYEKEFFDYIIKFAGSEGKLAKLLNQKKVFNIWYFKNGRRLIPLNLIVKILDVLPPKDKYRFRSKIENNIEELRYGYGKAKSILKPKLPIEFSPVLARIAGHISGDGGIRLSYGSYEVYYTSQNYELVDQFKNDITNTVGSVRPYVYYNKSDKTWMVRFPNVVGIILMEFFGPMVGDLKHVPKIVLKSDKEYKYMFLRAIYDDEGCFSSDRIAFGISNKQIAINVIELLKEFGISPGKITINHEYHEKWKPHYSFGIFGKDIKTFAQQINFSHKIKRKNLKNYLLNRKFRHKKGEHEIVILNELKGGNMTAAELSQNLKFKLNRNFRKQLFKLEKTDKVNVKKINGNVKLYGLKQ